MTNQNQIKAQKKTTLKSVKDRMSMQPDPKDSPMHDDPKKQLELLVLKHAATTKTAVAIGHMSRDRKVLDSTTHKHKADPKTGEKLWIRCKLPADDQERLTDQVVSLRKSCDNLESQMRQELKRIPIYTQFLERVYCMGPVISAYLIASVDINEATKPSNLQRFCGLGIDRATNRLDRPRKKLESEAKAPKRLYNAKLRTMIYLWATSMWKNSAKNGKWVTADKLPEDIDPDTLESRERKDVLKYKLISEEAPMGSTSKYLERWTDYKHRMEHSGRVDLRPKHNVYCKWSADQGDEAHMALLRADKAKLEKTKTAVYVVKDGVRLCKVNKGAKGFIHGTGWHKAADLLLEDLYTVWRTLEGLPVWPSYHAGKLGHVHNGQVRVNEAQMLTIEEALEVVGDVGARPIRMVDAAE